MRMIVYVCVCVCVRKKEMGSTRHALTPLLETQPYLPSFACQTLSGESVHLDWYYISV